MKERDSGVFRPSGRNSAKYRLTWGEWAGFRTSRSRCRLCRISSGNPEKSRRIDDPPAGRFYVEGEGVRGNSARSAEIQRNPLIGAIWRNFVPRGSAPDCVRYLQKPPTNHGRRYGEGEGFWGIPPDRQKFSDIATYLGRMGGISNPMDLRAIV